MKKFLLQNAVILFLLNCQGALGYLFQVFAGRGLTPAQYGSFNALNSFVAFISSVCVVLPMVIAKFTVDNQDNLPAIRGMYRRCLGGAHLLAILLFALACLCLRPIRMYLHLDDNAPVLVMAAVFGFSLVLPVAIGVLQGAQRFVGLGLSGTVNALARLLLLFPLVFWWSYGETGALFCGVAGILVGLLAGLAASRDLLLGESVVFPLAQFGKLARFALPTAMMAIGVNSLGTVDMVLARHYFPEDAAGFYASATVLGRIPLYLSGMLTMVLFPEAVRSHAAGEDGSKTLLVSLGLVGLTSGGVAALCLLFATPIVTALYGSVYVSAAPLLKVCSASMAILAVVNVIFSYCLARQRFAFLYILAAGIVGLFACISFYHNTPLESAWSVFGVVAVIAVATLTWLACILLWTRRRVAEGEEA